MKKVLNLGVLFFVSFLSVAQKNSLEYYLPENISYDSQVPRPDDFFGHDIGEWHLSHDKLITYLQFLDERSDRISIRKFGETHEERPQILLFVTSTENHQRLDELKDQHRALSTNMTLDSSQIRSIPLVVWMGYSIHGNESSGSNSTPLLAYHLAAAQGSQIDSLLSSTIILIDPSLNPDGLQRFSSWVNSRKSKNSSFDPADVEFNEPWPNGRTNHYWFDLNRDWLLLTQPESQARMKIFNEWKPNIVTDHHEMGSNSTFFFQPGVPNRTHPAIVQPNISLTQKLASYHAKAFDKQKTLYFSQENYDDFYPGKGSTYPDLNGSIGILFEQASSRGHARETDNGILYFSETIKNQFTVSLSTLEGALANRFELLKYQNDFFKNSLEQAKKDMNRAFIFGDPNDLERVNSLARLLQDHEISLYRPVRNIVVNKKTFHSGSSYIVPLTQPRYVLIKTMFEKRKTFKDSVFYDVSAWAMDLTYNLDFEILNSKNIDSDLAGQQMEQIEPAPGRLPWKSKYAYAIRWTQYHAPAVAYQLLKDDVVLHVTEKEFHDVNGNKFDRGTLIVPLGVQGHSPDEIYMKLQRLTDKYRVEILPIETGFTPLGVDLGSPSIDVLKKPEVLLLSEEGVDVYETGEIWHLLDNKMDIPVTTTSSKILNKLDLDRYTHIILPGGRFNEIEDSGKEKLKNWLNGGGVVIAQNDAVSWLRNQNILQTQLKSAAPDSFGNVSYADKERAKGIQNMSGAIFNTQIDPTHPLCYGYVRSNIPVFKTSKLWMETPKVAFNSPVTFTADPLLAGFISNSNLQNLKNTSALLVTSHGKGKIIAFSFTPGFRSAWKGTEKFFLNSLFFSEIVETNY